jgi:hypothetical protein
MRKQLKEAEADAKPLQGYACPGCGAAYNSMDAARLLDFATGELHCEDCKCVCVSLSSIPDAVHRLPSLTGVMQPCSTASAGAAL